MKFEQLHQDPAESDGRALLIASSEGKVLFATDKAKRWSKEFFGQVRRAGRLPLKICRWLAPDQSLPGQKSLVLKRGAKRLFVRRLGPWADDAITLLFEFDSSVTGRLSRTHAALTKRENDVLHWIAAGKSNREMAEILGLSAGTVSKHLERIFQKLNVENRTAAASFYRLPAEEARARY